MSFVTERNASSSFESGGRQVEVRVRLKPLSYRALLLLLACSGCFPHSCQRTESRELFASDSLSRALAERTPVDTLSYAWRLADAGEQDFRYPRSVRWSPDGTRLFVADVETGVVSVLDASGRHLTNATLPPIAHPYLAGWNADSLIVLDPDEQRIHFVVGSSAVRSIDIEAGDLLERSFVYGAHTGFGPAIKAVHRDAGARLLLLSASGTVRDTLSLDGPYWRHAGFLRSWGDTLLSLSGYRPVVDLVAPDGRIDSLVLQGFDSPMLSRSRLFVLGEVDEPPLLNASAAPAGPYLFVLNMRPGWLRVDAYDRDGVLRYVLEERRAPNYGYYPVDLDVHLAADGTYAIAVAVAGRTPRVEAYSWRPPGTTANP